MMRSPCGHTHTRADLGVRKSPKRAQPLHTPRRAGAPLRTLIDDPRALRALLLDRFGSLKEAGRRLRMERSTLSRLCSRAARRRAPEPLGAVWGGFSSPADRLAIEQAVLGPSTRSFLSNYRIWLAGGLASCGHDVYGSRWESWGPTELELESRAPASRAVVETDDSQVRA